MRKLSYQLFNLNLHTRIAGECVGWLFIKVVVIEFWHEYNYLSLNHQLQLSRLLTSNGCNYRKMAKLQITLLNYRSK